MITKMNYSAETIAAKQTLLHNARQILKNEFIGINAVIDSVIDSLTTWFLFPEIQERPLVINLWGMTGVGKTALVKRLSSLLNYDKKLFRFDMGDKKTDYRSMRDILRGLFNNNSGKPYMLLMDEFQYAKTKNEDDCEIDNPFSRVLWDLLDSGKFEAFREGESDLEEIAKLIDLLYTCIKEGVVVEKGLIVQNEEAFFEILLTDFEDEFGLNDSTCYHKVVENGNTRYSFLPKNKVKTLYKFYPKKTTSVIEFRNLIETLDGPETIELIEKIFEYGKCNINVDCTKTVIFIVGNLDDAYKMSSSFNPDINADDFHEASKEININHIKGALKKRFKNEQIARLGNNHIIYPAFSQRTFEQLIKLELKRTSAVYFEKFGINLAFTKYFCEVVYQEGVYPTQGTRPLYSTIYLMVNTKIPSLLSENIIRSLGADRLLFDFIEPNMRYTFYKDGLKIHELEMPVQLNLSKLRAPEKDDMQAITAVHETGHAIISMVASKILPEYICSTSADYNSAGFVVIKNKWNYLSKEEGIKKIAELLGGILAEKLIFGEDKITRGAEQDIERATELATKLIKDYGMGAALACIDLPGHGNRNSLLDNKYECNEEVKLLLERAKKLAEKILLQEKKLLLHLANYLSDERIIKKDSLEEMATQYGSRYLKATTFIEDGKHLFYRNHLKRQLQNSEPPVRNTTTIDSINSLNRSR